MAGTSFGGSWTLEKLDILQRYLDAYTTALKNRPFRLIYVDAFAGEEAFRLNAELYQDDYDDLRALYEGSARIALGIQDKPFDNLIFSETDQQRFEALARLQQEFPDRDIVVHNEDANVILPQFCENLQPLDRAVVFLDPFATAVDWSTVDAIARTEKIDCWIPFPVKAISQLMPTDHQPRESWAARLDKIFGVREHWAGLYRRSAQLPLFDSDPGYERPGGSGPIADRYRERLESVFNTVAPTRRILKNSRNSPMFELFFGASNPAGARIAVEIADHILKHW